MPSHLDLSLAVAHGKMYLQPRNSPRMTLRRSASPNTYEKAPLSSTSSRFSFNHLIHSPPPSPSLPALVPRHGRQLPSPTPRRFVRLLVWLSGVAIILYFCSAHIRLYRSLPSVGWSTHDDQEYEMIGDDSLPDFPTPVVVSDKRGRSKWTISIPSNYDFPLKPEIYGEICRQTKEASDHVADLHKHAHVTHAAHFDYYHVDPYFMDVAEAEGHGMLPGGLAKGWGRKAGSDGNIVGEKKDGLVDMEVCKTSMTFVMETADAGLGSTLMMLWTAYGLAEKEGRAFFVDDSRWAYGSYTELFLAPPMPSCRPPPRHEMLPCPHHARHLIVSAATAPRTFGGMFHDHFEDAHKMEVFRQKPIFALARAGYEALFHLADGDNQYVKGRVAEFRAKTKLENPSEGEGMIIGVHVRHGDRHPMEFQYSKSYIPLDRYSDKAREILTTTYNSSGPDGGENMMAEMHSKIVVASDDPDVYESIEFSHSPRAQDSIRLASNRGLEQKVAAPTGNMFKRFVDESVGWEGGFFAPMFWSLGRSSASPAAVVETPNEHMPPSTEALRLRDFVGRAYLLDLAVLAGASDAIVCTVSATGCRLLAVMMGWQRAIDDGKWVNIDGDFEWRGVSW